MDVVSPPRTAAAAMPSTMTASSTSMRTAPRSSEDRTVISDLHLAVDAVHRRDEGDRDEAHDDSHDQDDDRFEEGSQPLDLVAELAFVVVGRRVQLGVERPGLLADADHLRRGGREQPG